jgi:hypothetical protein
MIQLSQNLTKVFIIGPVLPLNGTNSSRPQPRVDMFFVDYVASFSSQNISFPMNVVANP